jgi:hypothetical protein
LHVCKEFPAYTIPFSPPSLSEFQHKRAGIAQTRSSHHAANKTTGQATRTL